MLEELSSLLSSPEILFSDASNLALHKVARKSQEVHTTLQKHLLKEEEQLLPLLLKNFSIQEQADLVVQFLCCIPYSAINPMLEWLRRSVSVDQQQMLLTQIGGAVSDPWLKEMVQAWLAPVDEERNADDGGLVTPNTPDNENEYFVCCGERPCRSFDESDRDVEDSVATTSSRSPLREIVYFHEAIRSAMSSFAHEAKVLHEGSSSVSPEQLQALAERHRFIRAVCQFHSASEDEVVFPVLHRVVSGVKKRDGSSDIIPADSSTHTHRCEEDHLSETARFEELGRLLGDVKACARRGAKEVAELTGELSTVAQKLSRSMSIHMTREETDVLPILMKTLCQAEQRHIVWKLVQAMPLRLLERFMPWISAKLDEKDVEDWLENIRKASNSTQKPLVELLSEWAARGPKRHGDTSGNRCVSDDPAAYAIETCGTSNRISLENHCHDEPGCSHDEGLPRPKRVRTGREPIGTPSTTVAMDQDRDTFKTQKVPGIRNPIDHIFQFHKALRQELKDLEAAAIDLQQAASSATDWCQSSNLKSMIQDLQTRFEFLRGIYRAHSRSEDEIVFPALEAKETLHNVSHAYSLDHIQEESLFEEVSQVVESIGVCLTTQDLENLRLTASKLSRMCAAVRASLETHVRAEEKELWPLFTEHFTTEEQEELVGIIIGQTGAEVLHVMLSWVTKSMTEDESNAMMSSLKSASKSTAFENWLGAAQAFGMDGNSPRNIPPVVEYDKQGDCILPSQSPSVAYQQEQQTVLAEVAAYLAKHNITGSNAVFDPIKTTLAEPSSLAADATLFKPGWEDIFRMNQKQLEAAVRRVSTDDSLEPQRKAYLIQHLMASRYIVAQQKRNKVLEKNLVESFMHHAQSSNHLSSRDPMPDNHLDSKGIKVSTVYNESKEGIMRDGSSQSFHDQARQVLGCKHYARKAKLIAPCCSKEYVCRLCHDEENVDHSMNRYQVREMRCMVCGTRQEVKKSCSECGTSLASYYCNICHLFDNDPTKDIYHCPFCNFCRRGKGLGIDSFHCMACNACMSLELFNKHKCTEAALAGTCPVCSDPLFESNTPIKELPCGHFMHSLCFGAYVRYSYTCPVCSKSLGDMEVYWRMIDAMLASEKLPMEYAQRRQSIRCHDCGAVSQVPFHFVYHKCNGCNGYNTRVISAKES